MRSKYLVKEDRQEYVREACKHKLHTQVPMQECRRETGKGPIGTRWVGTNQGDRAHPEDMSRPVTQAIKDYNRWDLCGATPPLESRYIRSVNDYHEEHRVGPQVEEAYAT